MTKKVCKFLPQFCPSLVRLVLTHHKDLVIGRDSGIRTHDPYSPRVVRYQAALCPDIKGDERLRCGVIVLHPKSCKK